MQYCFLHHGNLRELIVREQIFSFSLSVSRLNFSLIITSHAMSVAEWEHAAASRELNTTLSMVPSKGQTKVKIKIPTRMQTSRKMHSQGSLWNELIKLHPLNTGLQCMRIKLLSRSGFCTMVLVVFDMVQREVDLQWWVGMSLNFVKNGYQLHAKFSTLCSLALRVASCCVSETQIFVPAIQWQCHFTDTRDPFSHYANDLQDTPRPTCPYRLPNTTNRKMYALLIGCNYEGTPFQLNGCINDVKTMVSLLKRHYNMRSSEMTVLKVSRFLHSISFAAPSCTTM